MPRGEDERHREVLMPHNQFRGRGGGSQTQGRSGVWGCRRQPQGNGGALRSRKKAAQLQRLCRHHASLLVSAASAVSDPDAGTHSIRPEFWELLYCSCSCR